MATMGGGGHDERCPTRQHARHGTARTCHDPERDVREHRRHEEYAHNAYDRHHPYEVDEYALKFALFVGTEEVIASEYHERQGASDPRVAQKEHEGLEIPGTDAVVHPGAVVIHPAHAPAAYATVV